MSSDRRDKHGDLNMCISDEHIFAISTTKYTRILRATLTFVSVYSETKSSAS
jgi:hypothetical protein